MTEFKKREQAMAPISVRRRLHLIEYPHNRVRDLKLVSKLSKLALFKVKSDEQHISTSLH